MDIQITNPPFFGKVIDGFGLIASGLPNGVWNTVTLDSSVANKTVELHIFNTANPATARQAFVRQLDNNNNPIGAGIPITVGGSSTTSVHITTNKNAQIQVQQGGNGVRYIHVNTFK